MPRRGAKSVSYRDPPQGEEDGGGVLLDDRLVTASVRRTIVAPPAKVATILSTPFQRYNLATTVPSSPEGPSNVTNTAGSTPTPTTTAMNAALTSAMSIRRTRVTMTLAPKKRSKASKRQGVDQLSWFSSVTVDRDRSMALFDQGGDDVDDDDDDDDDLLAKIENSGSRSRPTSRTPSQSGWSVRSASRLTNNRARVTNSGSASPIPADERDLEPPRDLAEE